MEWPASDRIGQERQAATTTPPTPHRTLRCSDSQLPKRRHEKSPDLFAAQRRRCPFCGVGGQRENRPIVTWPTFVPHDVTTPTPSALANVQIRSTALGRHRFRVFNQRSSKNQVGSFEKRTNGSSLYHQLFTKESSKVKAVKRLA